MPYLLTEDLVRKAIELALPSARLIAKACTWGPEGFVFAIGGEGLLQPVVYAMEELGPKKLWPENWQADFEAVALEKLEISLRTGRPSREVIASTPWLLVPGDVLYTGAVAEGLGLAVAASGAKSEADECAAWLIFNLICMLCEVEIKRLREEEINHLPQD